MKYYMSLKTPYSREPVELFDLQTDDLETAKKTAEKIFMYECDDRDWHDTLMDDPDFEINILAVNNVVEIDMAKLLQKVEAEQEERHKAYKRQQETMDRAIYERLKQKFDSAKQEDVAE